MRIGSASPQDELEVSLVPLIDVVLTLIIFFVVTTTFQDRSTLKIDLPEATGQIAETPKDPLVVVVDGEGRYFVGGGEVLRRDVGSLREAIGKVAGEDKSRAVILRADAKTPHQSVVTAMEAIGQLGFSRLSIATVPPESGSP
ncbi:ExbD/TolR family protein [Pseudofulvimonas gallinarii]|uniref:Biopolymer transport protein ExbD n=1 Tax=Pseudofulvimonas gallinarii TaxID=634155 RepID=A0A4S3KS02_9GAMM|nr:biopolymer transporter ExbD [Pseudofulvimonas gallinarii]MCX7555850.1 biopolymer transporter ExbD [Xanthomonadaceae bacterium JHOS43]MCX7563273.1 biopolymer transporter ExbD [Xanthomonadaceae bacterium XH05]TCS92329.1 biopolymer transport protein ExbD [Pseudofulvimonas gallinarii]THD11248.1 biopolymer transporter ExbD [Pseudofulvimonas gallinarii]